MSTITLYTHRAAEAIDWRGRLGWAIVNRADSLYDVARRVSHGATPTPDTFTVDHLGRVADALGVQPSELVARIEDRGGVLR